MTYNTRVPIPPQLERASIYVGRAQAMLANLGWEGAGDPYRAQGLWEAELQVWQARQEKLMDQVPDLGRLSVSPEAISLESFKANQVYAQI